MLDQFCQDAEEWQLRPEWVSLLRDQDDEPLVQLAVESGARLVVTHNIHHLAPAQQLGVSVLHPRNFLAMLNAL